MALKIIAVYVTYVSTVLGMYAWGNNDAKSDDDSLTSLGDKSPKVVELDLYALEEDVEPVVVVSQKVTCERAVCVVWSVGGTIMGNLIGCIVPPLHPNTETSLKSSSTSIPHVPVWRAFLVFFTCIFHVGVLASVIVSLCEVLVRVIGVDSSTLGATLVALGSEVRIQ